MKYYLLAFIFIITASGAVFFLPTGVQTTEGILVSAQTQIPKNNAEVAGIQKYNIPPYSKSLIPPILTARAILVKDLNTDTILYEQNAYVSVPIASTTKIMTALISSQFFKQNSQLTVNEGASVQGSKVGLVKGEVLSFRSLLYGMLLNSGNDAAFTIAENYTGGTASFVDAMNTKAKDLNLSNTNFDNPAGFDSSKHYSSASDLAKITQEALKINQLTKIFATKDTEIVSLDNKHRYQLHNLNRLLTDVAGVLGVKTGYTQLAKENLVTLIDRGGHPLLIVVLGSEDRFGESEKLIDWTYNNYVWVN